MTKAQVRIAILRRLRNQQEDNRRRKSAIVRRKLFRLAAFRRATTVFCYVALPYEVQTWELIEEMLAQGKRVVVPVAQRRTKSLRLCELKDPAAELSRGAFGVWEPSPRRPLPARELDLALVPGLAFDRRGHRLGHGHGYFDRWLARLPKTPPTVGLAFTFQLLDRLPTAPHDRAVQTVLTG